MIIRSLANLSLATVVQAMQAAFAEYFVPLPTDLPYWQKRFALARVDWHYSYGAFADGQLVAFIIQGVDDWHGERTAFNTGTGVLPAYRGQQLVDQLYDYAMPLLKTDGFTRCQLEVITDNARAIRVYERIGFTIDRTLRCYKGTLPAHLPPGHCQLVPYAQAATALPHHPQTYSWDHLPQVIVSVADHYTTYLISDKTATPIGYATLHVPTGYVAQLYSAQADYRYVLGSVFQLSPTLKMNNVDLGRTDLHRAFAEYGIAPTLDQYEMSRPI